MQLHSLSYSFIAINIIITKTFNITHYIHPSGSATFCQLSAVLFYPFQQDTHLILDYYIHYLIHSYTLYAITFII